MAGTVTVNAGLASGTNWSSLITAIIDAKKARTITPLEKKVSAYEEKLTAWQSFNTTLLTLNNYIVDNSLHRDLGYDLYSLNLTSSDKNVVPSDVLSATISDSASTGQYSIEVTALAQSEKISTDTFASESAKPLSTNGGGDIVINGITVSLSSDDTLKEIASKINQADTGVRANILNSDGGSTLIIESDTEGAAGISLTDSNNVLEALGILESGTKKHTIRSGQDASITIDNNFTVTSSSNVIENAIKGVTLTLTGTNIGSKINLKISQDNSAVSSKVSTLVENINSVLTYISGQNSVSNDASKPLKGDISLSMVRSNISSAIFTSVAENSTYKTAISIGIGFKDDGTVNFDSDAFGAALKDDPTEAIGVLKSINNNLTNKLDVYVNPYTGAFNSIKQSIQNSIDYANERIDALNERYERETELLEKRYTALELLISKSNSLTSWLGQQTQYMTNKS